MQAKKTNSYCSFSVLLNVSKGYDKNEPIYIRTTAQVNNSIPKCP